MFSTVKKVMTLVLAGALSLSALTGCGGKSGSSGNAGSAGAAASGTAAASNAAGSAADAAGSPVEFSYFGPIWDPYTEDSIILDAWQKNTNTKIHFQWAQTDSYDTQLAAIVASKKLPDVIKMDNVNAAGLIKQGVLVPLDDYLEKDMPNFLSHISDSEKAYITNPDDGKIYGVGLIMDIPAAMSTMVRKDWLQNVGLQEPETWDDWVKVWTAFKEKDANGNGDPNDEIPLAIIYNNFYFLENAFGIKSNGHFSVVDGKYVYDPENPAYGDFLDAMRELYAKGILYQEYITCDDSQLNTIGSNDTLGSTISWAEQAKNYSIASQESSKNALFQCVVPIAGPNGDQSIPARDRIAENTYVTVNALKDGRIDRILQALDYLYSDDGVTLTNYGIEGTTYDMKDGKPVVNDTYNQGFSTARKEGLIPAILPFCFTRDAYMQYLMQGKTYDDLPAEGKSFVDGLNINDPYFYQKPPAFTTDAYADHSDLVDKQTSLRDEYIMGKITKEQYNTEYQKLKKAGLQDVIDAAEKAYESVTE
jgi:putative aldouronate transport system substrate-binding protein